jgi:hypothetical protein
MVQAIENLTALTTRLVTSEPHAQLAGWHRLVVDVLDARPVAGFADLLSRHTGERLELAVPSRLVTGLTPGTVIRLRARLAGGRAMAEKQPPPGMFGTEPPR